MLLRGTKYIIIIIIICINIFLPIPSLNNKKNPILPQRLSRKDFYSTSCQIFLRHTSTCHRLKSTMVFKSTVVIFLIKVILLTTFEASINRQAPHALFLPSYKRKSLAQILKLFPHFSSSSGGHE